MRKQVTGAVSIICRITLVLTSIFATSISFGQFREAYNGTDKNIDIKGISFISPSTGYVAFTNYIGFTQDSGHTFTKRTVTYANTNFNGYTSVNLTFGFLSTGVTALSKDSLFTYGDFGGEPSILVSPDQGLTWKLVFHLPWDGTDLNYAFTDLKFPGNSSIGIAVTQKAIYKTLNRGQLWYAVSYIDDLKELAFPSALVGYAIGGKSLYKTLNGGSSWSTVSLPPYKNSFADFNNISFVSNNIGYISLLDEGKIFKTTDGGISWNTMNDADVNPITCNDLYFTNDSTGYSAMNLYKVYKTTNSGKNWEECIKQPDYQYAYFPTNCLFFYNEQIGWAGASGEYLTLTTNAGGKTLPKAYFNIDTSGLFNTGIVKLVNYSRTNYTYKWLKNGGLLSTSYNTSYSHNIYQLRDTIQLIVSDGVHSDTAVNYVSFNPPVIISAISPLQGGIGATILITGQNFDGATSVLFGGTAAQSFTTNSSTSITAIVGSGSSGTVTVITPLGKANFDGFTFIPKPTITSFSPSSALAGTTITIKGTDLTGITSITFGGLPASSFNEVSSTEVTAVLGSGNTGDIVVTGAGGTASTAGFKAIPSITSFSPSTGTIGEPIVVIGTCFVGTSAVSIGGVPVKSFTIKSTTELAIIAGSGSSGELKVITAGGSASKGTFNFVYSPVINNISPLQGNVGTAVTIQGSGFNPDPLENTIFFGPVKASVLSASNSSLTVKVPYGVDLGTVSVTTNGLTAYSPKPFKVTFPDGGSITENSFVNTEILPLATGTNGPVAIATGDLNGDGKVDFVTANIASNSVTIFLNQSTAGNISFRRWGNITTGSEPIQLTCADVDNDGKLDIEVVNTWDETISILLNTTIGTTLSFASKVDIKAYSSPRNIAIGDIDGDGKLDIAIPNYPYPTISVLKNTSRPGSVSFDTRIDMNISTGSDIRLQDVDGDKKCDLIYTSSTEGLVAVLRNMSKPDSIGFDTPVIYTTGFANTLAVGDIDNDGLVDIVTGDANHNTYSIFRNKSVLGKVSFETGSDYPSVATPFDITLSDLDGDGKLDLSIAGRNNLFAVFKNIYTLSGDQIYTEAITYLAGDQPSALATGDLDNDGKSDVVLANEVGSDIFIFKNNVKPEPFVLSFQPTIADAGDTVIIKGANFLNSTSVTFGGAPSSSFKIISTDSIKAVVGTGASGTVSVTNKYGKSSKDGFVFGKPPIITNMSPISGTPGSIVTITGNNFSNTTSGNIVFFGNVRAKIISASTTVLKVEAPINASYQPVSVNCNSYTAYTPTPFSIIFPGAGKAFQPNSVGPKYRFGLGRAFYADLDNDGKHDMVVSTNGSAINLYRNIGSNGNIDFDFDNKITLSTGSGSGRVAFGDLNADGKIDIVTANYDGNSISVFINNSVNGQLIFADRVDYLTGISTTRPYDVSIGDIDMDGKPDIAVANYYSSTISVFRNTSTQGALSLGTFIDYFTYGYPTGILIRDLDGDKMPELIASVNGPNLISVFPNTSRAGNINFTGRVDQNVGQWPNGVAVGDLDNDGKLDIVTANTNGNSISVVKNKSALGNFVFDKSLDYSSGTSPLNVSLIDFDGDGWTDIITPASASSSTTVSIFKNVSTINNINISSKADYYLGEGANNASVVDMDMDGAPDLAVSGFSNLWICRNQVGEPKIASTGNHPVSGIIVNRLTIDPSVQTFLGSPYVQRHYDVEPAKNPATSTATITLYFTQADFDNYNTFPNHGASIPTNPTDAVGISNIRIIQYHGFSTSSLPGTYTGSGLEIDPDDSKIIWNATAGWWEVTFDVVGFSGFFLTSKGHTVLPVTLTSFTVNLQNGLPLLKWRTGSEINTSKFEIERRSGNGEFNKITEVACRNQQNGSDYAYVDDKVAIGTNYYRLKIVDNGGNYSYSTIRQVTIDDKFSLTIFPNPVVNNVIKVSVYSDKNMRSELQVTDISCKVISKQTVQVVEGLNTFSINVNRCSNGIYFLKMTSDKGPKTFKFYKK